MKKGLDLGTRYPPPTQNWWVSQRIGWGLLGMFLIAAIAGVFGDGPVSARTIENADKTLQIDYDRFLRQGGRTRLRVTLNKPSAAGDVQLTLNRAFVDAIDIERIVPAPRDTAVGAETLSYRFALTGGPTTITFDYKPRTFGRVAAHIGLAGAPAASFTHWVYP